MATTTKKTAAKKAPAKKKAGANTSPLKDTSAKGNFLSNAFKDAWGQLDEWVDTAKLKAKELAAEEKLMQKKAELAIKAEVDHAKHLAVQAEKWMRARVKSDARKLDAYEKKLKKQLRAAEKTLKTQAKAAERKANKKAKELKKKVEGVARKVAAPAKRAAPKRKAKAAAKQ